MKKEYRPCPLKTEFKQVYGMTYEYACDVLKYAFGAHVGSVGQCDQHLSQINKHEFDRAIRRFERYKSNKNPVISKS